MDSTLKSLILYIRQCVLEAMSSILSSHTLYNLYSLFGKCTAHQFILPLAHVMHMNSYLL